MGLHLPRTPYRPRQEQGEASLCLTRRNARVAQLKVFHAELGALESDPWECEWFFGLSFVDFEHLNPVKPLLGKDVVLTRGSWESDKALRAIKRALAKRRVAVETNLVQELELTMCPEFHDPDEAD